MKLICTMGRRVMVLPSGAVIHREDGSGCTDVPLWLGKKEVQVVGDGIIKGLVTKSGKLLTPIDIEVLVSEAEAGYDVADLMDRPNRREL
jgi:hypothetical protein